MTCPELLRMSAFLDGELEGAAATEAERHLTTCAECQGFAAAAAEIGDALRAPDARHTAPSLLRARVHKALDKEEGRPRSGFWTGMASGAGISAVAASLLAGLFLPPAAVGLSESVTRAHVRALSDGPRIEVASSSHHTVKPWFAGRAPLAPPVGDFSAQGFPLIGGRMDKVAGRPAAVVVYGHGLHEIDLFVWEDRGGDLPPPGDKRGYHETFWRRGDLAFAAVSDVDSAELARFVDLVKAQKE
jgi:anti-sigma factor RsiW